MSQKITTETNKNTSAPGTEQQQAAQERRLYLKKELLAAYALILLTIVAACATANNEEVDPRLLGENEIAITVTPSPTLTPTPEVAAASATATALPDQDSYIPNFDDNDFDVDTAAKEVASLFTGEGVHSINDIIDRYQTATTAFNQNSEALLSEFPGYNINLPFSLSETVRLGLDRALEDDSLEGLLRMNMWTINHSSEKQDELRAAQELFNQHTRHADYNGEEDVFFENRPGSDEAHFEDLWIDPPEPPNPDQAGYDEYMRLSLSVEGYDDLQAAQIAAFSGAVRLYVQELNLDWNTDTIEAVALALNTTYEDANLEEFGGYEPIYVRSGDGTYRRTEMYTMEDPAVRFGNMGPDLDGENRSDQPYRYNCAIIQNIQPGERTTFGAELDAGYTTEYSLLGVLDLDGLVAMGEMTPANFTTAAANRMSILAVHEEDPDGFTYPPEYEVEDNDPQQGEQFPLIKGCEPDVGQPAPQPTAEPEPTDVPGGGEPPQPTQPPVETPVPPTQVPPTQVPPTQVPPTDVPPTPLPTNVPPATLTPRPTDAPPSTLVPTPVNTPVPIETPVQPPATPTQMPPTQPTETPVFGG